MAIRDIGSERIFADSDLAVGLVFEPSEGQAHYLLHVLRLGDGDSILVFNGRDGEWRGRICAVRKKSCQIEVLELTRAQMQGPDIQYLFAPLKHARLDYMIQKAVELGVSRLTPVVTRRTVPDRINQERMRANAIEAAEQCGILTVPMIDPLRPLPKVLDERDPKRLLIFCDEAAPVKAPLAALMPRPKGPVSLLIGPEGGFDEEERQLVKAQPNVLILSLGPRVMRADTAAVAALAIVNATLGDWTDVA